MSRSIKKRWTLFGAVIGIGTTLSLVVGLGVFAGAGTAASSAVPKNTSPPTVSGTAQVGKRLAGDRGTWSNNPGDYNYFWTRCDKNGGELREHQRRARCVVHCSARPTSATRSASRCRRPIPTAPRLRRLFRRPWSLRLPLRRRRRPATGCPSGTGAVPVTGVSSPARLLIDQQQSSPSVVGRGTSQLIVRYHVSACGGRSVQGALVYATATPFNQLSVPPEATTDGERLGGSSTSGCWPGSRSARSSS